VTGRRERRRKQILADLKGNEKILETEKRGTRSHSVDKSL